MNNLDGGAMRKDGYYWVRLHRGTGDWYVALWMNDWGGKWFFAGRDDPYNNDDLGEVDERGIVRGADHD